MARVKRQLWPQRRTCTLALLACLVTCPVSAQDLPRLTFEQGPVAEPPAAIPALNYSPLAPGADAAGVANDPNLRQVSCSTCGSGLLGGGSGCTSCASGPHLPCVPGRKPYCGAHYVGDSKFHRLMAGLYECLCCPDPCYDPTWIPLGDAAFYAASARPQSQQRIRWDAGCNVVLPDRAEFFWARQDGKGKGPKPPGGSLVNSNRVRYDDLIMYTEAGNGTITAIVETPYRALDAEGSGLHSANFADIKVGTKTLLLDCELLQVGLQMLTYIPSGSPGKGLGTGHVSLEPSILVGLKLSPSTYFQHQLSEWIPLGGDPSYAGAILHSHTSVNQMLYRFPGADVSIVGTGELQTWSFQDGAFTDPVLGPLQPASGFTYVSMGSGVRCFICDRFDIGFAASFSLTSPHFAGQVYTTEFRFRY